MGRPTFTTGGSVLNHDVHEVSLAVSPTDQRPGALPMEDCRPASVERIAGTFSARPHSGIRGGLPPRTAAYRLGGASDPAVSGRSRVANVCTNGAIRAPRFLRRLSRIPKTLFWRRPNALAPFPFTTREFARLLVLRSRVDAGLCGVDDL